MANYANLLATIAANIYTNGNNEVTASMVKTSVDAMVASLGAGYQFIDVAIPATNPGSPDYKCFYIASEAGTYTNFLDSGSNPLVVNEGEVAVLKYDTAWSKEHAFANIDEATLRGILIALGFQSKVNYMIPENFRLNTAVDEYGNFAPNTDRSILAFEIQPGANTVTKFIRVSDNYNIVALAVSWWSSKPNFVDSTGFISRASGGAAPFSIPSGATWCIVDTYTIRFGDNIRVEFFPQYTAYDRKLSAKDYDNFELGNDDNYVPYVLENVNIDEYGKLIYFSGRNAIIVKLKEGVTSFSVSGISPVAYGWWSGIPDFVTGEGSTFITRTNSPVIVAGAKYVTLAFITAVPATIKVVQNTETTGYGKLSLSAAASFINNSIGENNFANGLRSDLKILGFGNSFMRNSVAYLSSIADGIDGINLVVGNLYTGGTQLADHLAALNNASAVYEWYKYESGAQVEGATHKTPQYGLLSERWDAIILHQYQPAPDMPSYQPFEPYLNELIAKIIEVLGYTPKFYLNATWAGSLDNNVTYYGYSTEAEMWEAVLDANKQACVDSGINKTSIIPTGTAIQNARTLSYATTYNRFVNAGTDWHHLNPAGGFIAACTIWEKIVAPLNGKHCDETTFRIPTDTYLPPSTSVETGIVVTDSNYQSMCKCAIDAVADPWNVTNQ